MKLDLGKKAENIEIGDAVLDTESIYMEQKLMLQGLINDLSEGAKDNEETKDEALKRYEQEILRKLIFSGELKKLFLRHTNGNDKAIREMSNLQVEKVSDEIYKQGLEVDTLGF